ncbi:MAG: SPFH domain-containing protein [Bacillota bacterium]
MLTWLIGGGFFLIIILITSVYKIVPAGEAHLVITPGKRMVCASDKDLRRNKGKSWYFYIPSWVPLIGRAVRRMDVTIKELVIENQETYEKDQARYLVNSSTKYRINNISKAGETFINDMELRGQLKEIIKSAIRAVTVKYSVTDVRANKKRMSEEVEDEIRDDLHEWGLKLVSFALVDFQDTPNSKVISNISRRREVQIESETRIDNANRKKEARMKEAESDQAARDREIERDEAIARRGKTKEIVIAKEDQKVAEEQMKVKKVNEVEQEKIDKEQSVIKAEADKERRVIEAQAEREQKEISAAAYRKEQQLQGEGNAEKTRIEAEAEAEAIEKQGLAEAKVEEEKAKAFNQYTDDAIQALTAEDIVNKEKEIGISLAQALSESDMKFINAGQSNTLLELLGTASGGANLGSMIDSLQSTADLDLGELSEKLLADKDQEQISQKEEVSKVDENNPAESSVVDNIIEDSDSEE